MHMTVSLTDFTAFSQAGRYASRRADAVEAGGIVRPLGVAEITDKNLVFGRRAGTQRCAGESGTCGGHLAGAGVGETRECAPGWPDDSRTNRQRGCSGKGKAVGICL